MLLRSSFHLPPTADAPAAARQLAGILLRQWAVPEEDVRESALLVVSELVTNAVKHTSSEDLVEVSLEFHQAEVRVAVADSSPAIPRQRAAGADEESGRGLAIVEAIARRWGVEPVGTAAGKRVYAVLALDPARCA